MVAPETENRGDSDEERAEEDSENSEDKRSDWKVIRLGGRVGRVWQVCQIAVGIQH